MRLADLSQHLPAAGAFVALRQLRQDPNAGRIRQSEGTLRRLAFAQRSARGDGDLREIEAGQFEGAPEATIAQTYFAAPTRWLQGDRSARIPGSVDGNEFDARFDEAVQRIYDSGQQNPVAFSHSAAIMFWVLMNVRNPDPSLVKTKSLPNVGHVVLTGNPSDGWTLTEWDADPPPC